MKRKQTKTMASYSSRQRLAFVLGTMTLLFVIVLSIISSTHAQSSAALRGRPFGTAEEAANALIEATEKYDEAALKDILGPDSWDIIHTGEPARDKEMSMAFAAQARSKMTLDLDGKSKTRSTLIVGDEDWPFPVPIVKAAKSWFFDTKAGRQELLFRRIGRNDLDAIQVCRGYVEAQHEYALTKRGTSEI